MKCSVKSNFRSQEAATIGQWVGLEKFKDRICGDQAPRAGKLKDKENQLNRRKYRLKAQSESQVISRSVQRGSFGFSSCKDETDRNISS